jgi:uncharacterized protein YgbK (DUF1537 family)
MHLPASGAVQRYKMFQTFCQTPMGDLVLHLNIIEQQISGIKKSQHCAISLELSGRGGGNYSNTSMHLPASGAVQRYKMFQTFCQTPMGDLALHLNIIEQQISGIKKSQHCAISLELSGRGGGNYSNTSMYLLASGAVQRYKMFQTFCQTPMGDLALHLNII